MTDTKTIIAETTARILEDWAMMLVEPAPNERDIFDRDQSCMITTVNFTGVVNGTYTILCQAGFIENLAANLLGLDEDPSEEDWNDALREMANVLCGNLLTECYGEDTVFELILPAVVSPTEEEMAKLFNERTVCYLADDEPVLVTFDAGGVNAD